MKGQHKAVTIDFHEEISENSEEKKKIIYVRSAYRNEPDFTTTKISRMNSILDGHKVSRLIENNSVVSENYQRIVSASVAGIYSGDYDEKTVADLREIYIGQIRDSMSRVFHDLLLTGPGDPMSNGAFYFDKGTSKDFHYKNLSGGEKAAFDLILDFIIKRNKFDNSIFVIDEPESHMHTRLQARLLEELCSLIPANSQLWIATHSIGMMRKAKELKESVPNSVVFLNFDEVDFDGQVVLEPQIVNRQFWTKALGVALDDLANIVAPRRVVLCEGEITNGSTTARSEFDAKCYRTIFAEEFADTDFISAGNSSDVESDRLHIGRSLKALISGIEIIRIVDRDDKSPQEVEELQKDGIKVLSRRHLESYLLDNEVIEKLCQSENKNEHVGEALKIKEQGLLNSQGRSNALDDVKSAAGEIYIGLKKLLELTGCGNNTDAFLRDTMAPLVTKETQAYRELKADIFG